MLADGETVPYGELPLLYHLPAYHDSREEIILTCHKTPKSQMYYTDVVFINSKYYTHYNADS